MLAMRDFKILVVDDDPQLLRSFKRLFSGKLSLDTAEGVSDGLKAVSEQGPYAVVISDYRMPLMNGVQFLSKVKIAQPDTVRILLTGYADLKTAIEAVNEGNIFRLLTKPCPAALLAKSLADGIRQYKLVRAERDLLERTLSGSIAVLSELLSLAKPEAFGRASRIADRVKEVARQMDASPKWEIAVAAMLSQIGLIVFPDSSIRRIAKGRDLPPDEKSLFNNHPQMAADLIRRIPRMDRVAAIVAYQEKRYDGSGIPEDDRQCEDIPLGARILKVVIDLDALIFSGRPVRESLAELKGRTGHYDPAVLESLEALLGAETQHELREVAANELMENMVLADDVYTVSPKKKLLGKGQKLSKSVIMHIQRYNLTVGVEQPIKVSGPD